MASPPLPPNYLLQFVTDPILRAMLGSTDCRSEFGADPTEKSLLGLYALAQDPDGLGYREVVAWKNLTGDPYAKDAIDRHGRYVVRRLYGERVSGGWQVDHYPIPKSLDGPDVETNWMACSYEINEYKGSLLSAMLRRGT